MGQRKKALVIAGQAGSETGITGTAALPVSIA